MGGILQVDATMIDNAPKAISLFKNLWQTRVLVVLNHREQLQFQNFLPQANISAQKITCSLALSEFNGIQKTKHSESILYGKLSALSGQSDCWRITAALGFTTVEGFIDADSGDLLFVWDIPEG